MTVETLEVTFVTCNSVQYCHVVCSCKPKISLCGAYKPTLCGIHFLDTVGQDSCPTCKKPYCQICSEMGFDACPYCGD